MSTSAAGGADRLHFPVAAPRAHGEPGHLVVLEGVDRSGRSTHARLLEEWLRHAGHGVIRTSFVTSRLAAPRIRDVRRQADPDPFETFLLYAADLTERIEQVIMPSLRAGLVVLVDRYAYTPIARAAARGVDLVWLESVLAFAPPPDLVCFLDVAPADALQRHREIAEARLDADGLDAYREFQEGVYRVFDEAARRWGFTRVPATADIGSTHAALDRVVGDLLDGGGADAAHRRLPASLRGRR